MGGMCNRSTHVIIVNFFNDCNHFFFGINRLPSSHDLLVSVQVIVAVASVVVLSVLVVSIIISILLVLSLCFLILLFLFLLFIHLLSHSLLQLLLFLMKNLLSFVSSIDNFLPCCSLS